MYMMLMLIFLFFYFFLMIGILMGMSFFTLLERKSLSYLQLRKGPSKVGYTGLLQPMADATKLFTKNLYKFEFSNKYLYILCPMLSLFLSLMGWTIFMNLSGLQFNNGGLFYVCVLSVTVYSILGGAWISNSKYAMLGGVRSMAQTISYEISLIIMMIVYFNYTSSYKLNEMYNMQMYNYNMSNNMLLFGVWMSSCLAELSRTPFDFSESESELVSGFNTEYSSGPFAIYFMSEYMMIMLTCMMTSVLMMGGSETIPTMVFLSYLIVIIRGTLPRYRYDKFMYLSWVVFLTISLLVFYYSLVTMKFTLLWLL